MSLTTNKACVRFLRSTIMPALRPSPARSKPLSGDFCSRMQASARLAHIRSSQVPVPSFSSPTALHYCSSHCQPHRRPALPCSALLSANTQQHHPSAISLSPHTRAGSLIPTSTHDALCRLLFRRASTTLSPFLSARPVVPAEHALQIASLASPSHSTVANRSPTASRGLRTVRSPQPLVSCCTFASFAMASKVCMLHRPPPVDANGSAPCATVQRWRPTTQILC